MPLCQNPADPPVVNVVWAIDLQFESTIDGKAVKITSMIEDPPARIAAEHHEALDRRRAPHHRTQGSVRRGRLSVGTPPFSAGHQSGWTSVPGLATFPIRGGRILRRGSRVIVDGERFRAEQRQLSIRPSRAGSHGDGMPPFSDSTPMRVEALTRLLRGAAEPDWSAGKG
jgi:hypothetical protein